MALLRPSCAALTRRFCVSQQHVECGPRSPILRLLHSTTRSRKQPQPQSRAFSHIPRYQASVINTPHVPTNNPEHRKRTVRIGPLPRGPVKDAVIQRVFRGKLSATEGNNVLRILHHRRTAGSLADYGVDNLGKEYKHVKPDLALKGLEWLREHYPIDEARAAEEWAEREANRIAYELWLADPETESKYKDPARAFKEQMEQEEQEILRQDGEGQKIGILHTGKSQFELNIEEKRRQRLDEITRVAEEKEKNERDMEAKLATGEWVRTPTGTQLMKPGQTTYVDLFGREQVSRRKQEMEKYSNESMATTAQSTEELLAQTTLIQRLYPMTAFVFLTVLLCLGTAHYYQPPSPSYRLFPDISPTFATIATLIAINAAVTVAWRVLPLWPFLSRYFMHVPGYPRAVQSILNVFSHMNYDHLFENMIMLALVGPMCCDLVGRGVFMSTYISAGAIGTLASLYWSNLGRGNITSNSLGASAAIWGVTALFLLLTDKERIEIPFIKDLSVGFWSKSMFVALVAVEVYSAIRTRKLTIDYASHFGGLAVGMAVAGYMRATGFHEKKMKDQAAADEGKTKTGEKDVSVKKGGFAN